MSAHNPIVRSNSVTAVSSSPSIRARSLSSPQMVPPVVSSKSKSKNSSVAYCLPARKTNKRQSLPPISKSVSNPALSTAAAAPAPQPTQQSQPLKVWLMSLLKISNSHRTAPAKTLSAPVSSSSSSSSSNSKGKAPQPAPQALAIKVKPLVREVQPRAQAYIKLIETHSAFFKGCPEIDCYLIAMAYLYLERALPVIPVESMNTQMLFFALYLAWESEEDSTVGIEGIIHYIIGPYPSSRGKDKITRKYEIMEWKRKLNVFHTGKDKLWRMLDFNTYADLPTITKAMLLFPENDIFTRARKPSELNRYF